MVRFSELERLGVSVAMMTDAVDGDCRLAIADCGLQDGADGGLRLASPTLHSGVEARARACAACGIRAEDLVCGKQVHGTEIAAAGEDDRGRGVRPDLPAFPGTDGLITNVRGLPLAIFVADCVPVCLVEPNTGCIALVHAGREGTLHGIASLAVERLRRVYGANPMAMHALIGPSAGPCCYEVDRARAVAFVSAGLPVRDRRLDLWESNARQLARAGIPCSHIAISGVCTICTTTYYSHRRSPNGCRNAVVLAV